MSGTTVALPMSPPKETDSANPLSKPGHVSWRSQSSVNGPQQPPSNSGAQTVNGFAPRKMADSVAGTQQDSGREHMAQPAMKGHCDSMGSDIRDRNDKDDQEEEEYLWDQFESIPIDEEEENSTEKCIQITTIMLKIAIYLLLFAAIIVGLVIAKVCILTMTSHMQHYNSEEPNEDMYSAWAYIILIAVCAPYFFTFLQMGFKIIFGQHDWPSIPVFISALVVEAAHSFGLTLLLFKVLPNLDAVRGVLVMSAVAIVPSILNLMFGLRPRQNNGKKIAFMVMDCLAVLGQLSSIITFILLAYNNTSRLDDLPGTLDENAWELPLSVFCLSLQWISNFCNDNLSFRKCVIPIQRLKSMMYTCQVKLTFLMQIAKIGLTFGFTFALVGSHRLKPAVQAFAAFHNASQSGTSESELDSQNAVYNANSTSGAMMQDWIEQWLPFTLLVISPLLVFYLSIVSAQLHMQLFPFSLSTTMATPVAVIIVAFLPAETTGFLYYNKILDSDNIFIVHIAIGAVWWLSQLWISRHVWTPKNLRLERVDGLFATPGYCAVLLEQCLVYNRRKDEDRWRERLQVVEAEEAAQKRASASSINILNQNIVPMIYICATMWHENENEMLQMLKSIVRLDEDQATRRNAMELLKETRPELVFNDPDFYNFEAHIFFDDSMELNDDDEWTVNSFVRLFVATVDRAASAVFNRSVELEPPVKCPTPYGGRLMWTLPGENKLIVHLKDKNKIRHRKRWSQIMYMYYLLGYKLLGEVDMAALYRIKNNNTAAAQKKRQQHFAKSKLFDKLPETTILQAEHTFCLALDGDVDFRPQALGLLVDRLKRNNKVGVVCGRIHPIGSGPMVWYQKFEYAISHWLQKAAEHVLGCVLCAPGAFSLFRGSALMDDNVMGTYVRLATEAGHYVQYDQGEDRWLCTLLLQQGYRVEYVAASDALTYAPESFNEFFNQRRRWGPSTMANIMDLLMSWSHTIKINNNISTPFMIYQALIFFSSLLGPATIILMIAGAFNNVFGISLAWSYVIATVPPVFYVIICFFTKPNTQVSVAAVMSAIYALIMTAVLIATIAEIAQTSLLSPSGIFLLLLTAVFITSAVFHPQEFWCLAPGLLYYICIPSGYLLLIIYSMANLNVVSWGTREVAQRKPKGKKKKKSRGGSAEAEAQQEQAAAAAAAAAQQKRAPASGGLLSNLIERQMDEKSLCSLIAKFFRQCCSGKDEAIMSMLRQMESKLEAIQREGRAASPTGRGLTAAGDGQVQRQPSRRYRTASVGGEETGAGASSRPPQLPEGNGDEDESDSDAGSQTVERNDLINPAWIEEDCLRRCTVNFLDKEEIEFWQTFIAKRLKPLDHDKENEKKIAADLKTLRNNVCFAFFMMNAIWIALMLVIQLKADSLQPVFIAYAGVTVEPVGLIFLSVFAVTLVLQYLAMLWHRWSTLRHIMATTRIELPSASRPCASASAISSCAEGGLASRLVAAVTQADEKNEDQMLREAQKIARDIQRSSVDDGYDDDGDDDGGAGGNDDDTVYENELRNPSATGSQKSSGKDNAAPGSTGLERSSTRLFDRKSTKRLSLRKRFQKGLHRIQTEIADGQGEDGSVGAGAAGSSGGRAANLAGTEAAAARTVKRSDQISVKIQRLRSTKLKQHRRPGELRQLPASGQAGSASDSRV